MTKTQKILPRTVLYRVPERPAKDTRSGYGMTKYFERCHYQLLFCTKILFFIREVEVSHVDT